jgi:hypothetical protein
MTEADELLVRIISMVDATWRPLRAADWKERSPAAIYEARARFEQMGVPCPTADGDLAQRAIRRRLNELQRAGLIKLCGKERRFSARATRAGDMRGRALAGLPNVNEAHTFLADVRRLAGSGDGYSGMAREIWFFDAADYEDSEAFRGSLLAVQEFAAPALWRDWAIAESDTFGRVYYSLTKAGRTALLLPEPELPTDLPEPSGDAYRLYDLESVAFRQRLRASEPAESREIGYVPLPASIALNRRKAHTHGR